MHLHYPAVIRRAVMLAACAVLTNGVAAAAVSQPASHAPALRQPTQLEPSGSRRVIYIANAASNSITIYPDAVNNPAPIGTITAGISSPQGVCVDYSRNLYVANAGSNTVTVYHPGKGVPYLTYSAGIGAPSDVTVDKNGTVYVANQKPASIVEFAKGSTTPTAIITDVADPTALALDRSGNLFVTDVSPAGGPSRVLEYPAGSLSGIDLGIAVQYASGIAFDPASGDLYVADEGANMVYGYHQPFAMGSHRPGPSGVFVEIQVVGPLHIIWITTTPAVSVSQYTFNEVAVFAHGLPQQTGVFLQGLNGPTAATLSQRLF
jgi:sugar lactone lactonase YvrE